MTRADAGIPRLTARDERALAWLEDMRVIAEPELAVLLGWLAGRGPVSATPVRTAIRRWHKLGLVKVEKLYTGAPRMIWLTSEGAGVVGARGWREPGRGVQRHTAEVARVRLWLEQRGIAGQRVTSWISERVWRQGHRRMIEQGQHVPDGVAVTEDGTQYAIEVELSDKGPGRTAAITQELTKTFSHVIYLVPAQSAAARQARKALEQASHLAGSGRAHVMELPERSEMWRSDDEYS